MDLRFSEQEEGFRAAARAWLEANLCGSFAQLVGRGGPGDEHALLDDNGDKKGSPDPTPTGSDGRLAAALSLGSAADAAPLPADPTLRALYLERRELERRVEALRLLKDSLSPARYASEFERLVTDLALKTREIRTLEGDVTL